MPQSLSTRRDEILRNLLYNNWDQTNVSGYDPTVPTGKHNVSNLTIQNNETVTVPSGETQFYADITINNGGTLDIDGTVYADTVTNNGTIDNDGTLIVEDSRFLPITTNWYRFGNQHPSITLSNFDTTVVGGGNTNWTGMNSNGGLNQERNDVGQLTIRVEDRREDTYHQGTRAQDLLKELRDECDRIIGENGEASFNNEVWWVENSGWTENVETAGEGTVTFTAVSDVGIGWLQTN